MVADAEAAHVMRFRSARHAAQAFDPSLLMRGVEQAPGVLDAEEYPLYRRAADQALREGRDHKVLILANGERYEFSAREGSQELGVIAFEDVTQRIAAEEKIRAMARYDSLTGLPTSPVDGSLPMHGISDRAPVRACRPRPRRFRRERRAGPPGRRRPDLCAAERLAAIGDGRIKVGRFGGDDCRRSSSMGGGQDPFLGHARSVFRCAGDLDVAGHVLRIQASGGRSSNVDGDVSTMTVEADLALLQGQGTGPGRWSCSRRHGSGVPRQRLLKADLRSTVEAGACGSCFQPMVAVQTMRIASCEALCRSDRPTSRPDLRRRFVALLAEEWYGLGHRRLRAADGDCQESAGSRRADRRFRRSRPRTSAGGGEYVALVQSGLSAERLEVEVTETAFLDDKSLTRQVVEGIKKLTWRLRVIRRSLSAWLLHKLPLDKVKMSGS